MKEALRQTVIWGVLVLPFVPLIVTGSLFFSYITGKNFAFRMIVEVVFAAWVLLALYDPEYRPRFSWVGVWLSAFVGVMFLADAFGLVPSKSLWSNFERMEGFVMLAHLLLYFAVAGTMLTKEKLWDRFFNSCLIAASLIAVYACAQLLSAVSISQSGHRIDATLGNAIYMAVYMLFNVAIALYMLAHATRTRMRVLYATLAVVFAFLLLKTETRGTIIGLVVGIFVAALYSAVVAKHNRVVRKVAVIGVAVVLGISGLFYLLRDSSMVTHSPVLSRIASISLAEGSTRFTLWGIALEGVKERPILGWGQNNFDYVFDSHYRPSLYAQEAWFDRVHDTYLDWLIAGGVLGLLTYLALWLCALYFLAIKPLLKSGTDSFSVVERSIFFGALVGYGVHNIFVFDNLISYFFFVTILAYIHARTAEPMSSIATFRISPQALKHIATPVVGVLLCLTLYYVNVPGIRAAGGLIDALTSFDMAVGDQGITAAGNMMLFQQSLDQFRSALDRDSFGNQEIREQLASVAQRLFASAQASDELKKAYVTLAETELQKQLEVQPRSARTRMILGSLYQATGQLDKALAQFELVEKISSEKQSVLFSVAAARIDLREYDKAQATFKKAFLLAPQYEDARVFYIISSIYTGNDALVAELSAPPYDTLYKNDDRILRAYYVTKRYAIALRLVEGRIANAPGDVQLRISKAAIQNESGDVAGAIATLTKAGKEFPDFTAQAEKFIAEVQKKAQ